MLFRSALATSGEARAAPILQALGAGELYVRTADKVVVIDGGRIFESGTHAELVARGGKYAELVDHFTRGKAGSSAVTDRT